MVNRIIEAGPVNWSDALAKYYAEDEKKWERQRVLLEARDKQQLKASAAQSFPKQLEALAKFTTSGMKLKKALDAKAAQAEVEDDKELQKTINYLGSDFKQTWSDLKTAEFRKEEGAIYTPVEGSESKSWDDEVTRLTNKLEGMFENDPHRLRAARDIRNLTGRRQHNALKLLGYDAIAGLTQDTMRADTAFTSRDSISGFDGTIADEIEHYKDDSKALERIFDSYRTYKLAPLGLNQDAVKSILGGELIRQKQTLRALSNAQGVTAISTEEDRNWYTQLKVANDVGSFADAVVSMRKTLYAESLESGKFKSDDTHTSYQKINAYIFGRVSRLAQDGYITTQQLQPYLDTGIVHPAGDTEGKVIFTKKQIDTLVKQTTRGEARNYAVQEALAKQSLPSLRARAAAGEDVSAEAASIGKIFPNLKEQSDKILEIKPGTQTQTAFERADSRLEALFKANNLTVEDVNAIDNEAAKDKWLPIAKKGAKWNAENNYPEQREVYKGQIVQLFRKKSLEKGMVLTDDEKLVLNEIDRYADLLRAKKLLELHENPDPNRNVLLEVQNEVKDWLARNSWGQEGEGGMFAIKPSWGGPATMPNLRRAMAERSPRGYDHRSSDPNLIENYEKNKRNFNSKEQRQATAGGIYSNEMLSGFATNGFFSEDMKKIAALEGLLPGEALELAINALKGTKEGKDFLERNNLIQGEEESKLPPDVELNNQLVEALDQLSDVNDQETIKRLVSHLRWYGFDSIRNPNTRKKIYRILSKVSPIDEGFTKLESTEAMFRRSGISDEDIEKWRLEEIRKREQEKIEKLQKPLSSNTA